MTTSDDSERALKIYADTQQAGEQLRSRLVGLGVAAPDCAIELVYGRCLRKPAVRTRRVTYEGELAIGFWLSWAAKSAKAQRKATT